MWDLTWRSGLYWILHRRNSKRNVMKETFRNLASVGGICKDHDIEDQYENHGTNLSIHIIKRPGKSKQGSQYEENLS